MDQEKGTLENRFCSCSSDVLMKIIVVEDATKGLGGTGQLKDYIGNNSGFKKKKETV